MALDVENFTSPGKHSIDLKLEGIEKELKKKERIHYINKQEKNRIYNSTIKIKYNRTQNK